MRIRTFSPRRVAGELTADAAGAPGSELRRLVPRRPDRRWLGLVLGLVAAIVLADALVGEQSLSSGIRSRRQYDAVNASLAALRGENARLREQVRRLRDDPEAIEFVARKDLGLARPGEILVVLK